VALIEGGGFAARGAGGGLRHGDRTPMQFAFSEVKLGLVAHDQPYVVAAIGPRKARRLFSTGEAFDAAYAARSPARQVVEDQTGWRRPRRSSPPRSCCAPGAVASPRLWSPPHRPPHRPRLMTSPQRIAAGG